MHHETERNERTRRRVLKVAARAIRAEGPHRTSKADLVAQAIDARAHIVTRFELAVTS